MNSCARIGSDEKNAIGSGRRRDRKGMRSKTVRLLLRADHARRDLVERYW